MPESEPRSKRIVAEDSPAIVPSSAVRPLTLTEAAATQPSSLAGSSRSSAKLNFRPSNSKPLTLSRKVTPNGSSAPPLSHSNLHTIRSSRTRPPSVTAQIGMPCVVSPFTWSPFAPFSVTRAVAPERRLNATTASTRTVPQAASRTRSTLR